LCEGMKMGGARAAFLFGMIAGGRRARPTGQPVRVAWSCRGEDEQVDKTHLDASINSGIIAAWQRLKKSSLK